MASPINVVASSLIGILMIVIIGGTFINVAEDAIDENDTDGLASLTKVKTMFYLSVGILTIIPIAYIGRIVMDMF